VPEDPASPDLVQQELLDIIVVDQLAGKTTVRRTVRDGLRLLGNQQTAGQENHRDQHQPMAWSETACRLGSRG
jgi:hypothetical protein